MEEIKERKAKILLIILGFLILAGTFLFALTTKASFQPDVVFSANPSVIQKKQSVALSWSATSSMYCIASGDWSGNKLLFGSENVFPEKTANYNINCVGVDGITSAFRSVVVAVLGSPSPVPISGPISIEQFKVGCAASPSPGRVGEKVIFVASQAGGNLPVSYQWSGDIVGTDVSIETFFSTLGAKTANLLAIDSFGRRAETSCSLQVNAFAAVSSLKKQVAQKPESQIIKKDSQMAAIGVGAEKGGKSLLLWFFLILSGLANFALIIYIFLTRKGENKIEARPKF